MAGNICKLLAMAALLSTTHSQAGNVLFEIGTKDNSAAEFALYPGKYKNFLMGFSGVKHFAVGYSRPSSNWPYVLPGPKDNWGGGGYWAGYHPRHFPIINFQLAHAKAEGNCQLAFYFAGISAKESPVLRVEINGHRLEKKLKGTSTDQLLTGKESAIPSEWIIDFPAAWLKKGMNQIQLGLVKGKWCMFDCIRLTGTGDEAVQPISSSLITSVEAAGFEYKQEDGTRFQPVMVDMVQYDHPRTLTFTCGTVKEKRLIETGSSIQQILLPSVRKATEEVFTIHDGNQLVYRGTVRLAPQPLHTYADDVDLLMGTGNSRWMYKPSISLPLGMVQIAPDNEDETWKAGYEYTIENISGFNHFCDWTIDGFLMQPTCGKLQVNPGPADNPDAGYRSRIDKSTEKAEVGKYSVFMTDTQIKAELSATDRASIQAYTFPSNCKDGRILVDLYAPSEYLHNLQDAHVVKVSDTEIEGYATYFGAYTGYSAEQYYTIHFVMQFDKPFTAMGGWVNDQIKAAQEYQGAWYSTHEFETAPKIMQDIHEIHGKGDVGFFLSFPEESGESTVKVRTGVSLVDIAGARNNLQKELAEPFGWDFAAVVRNQQDTWNDLFGRLKIKTDDRLEKVRFYNNMYRSICSRNIWSDVNGEWVSTDGKIRKVNDPENDVMLGCDAFWNSFWNLNQFWNLVTPEWSGKWVRSQLAMYDANGWLAKGPAGLNYIPVMVGEHEIPLIVGAYQMGIRDFDADKALEAAVKMQTTPAQKVFKGFAGNRDLVSYMEHGYVPYDLGRFSNTMEYSYDDWTVGQLAKALGNDEIYKTFNDRGYWWKNVISDEGYCHMKDSKGNWMKDFDPFRSGANHHYVEGNAWQLTFFVPQDVPALVEKIGKDRFMERLLWGFNQDEAWRYNAPNDQYWDHPVVQGNQQSMHFAFLFNYAGYPWHTQRWSRSILERYYGCGIANAYLGDEDQGQMSAWAVMTSIGLFQTDGGCRVDPVYEIASPAFEEIVIDLGKRYGRGKTFVIKAANASKKNIYVQKATLNGRELNSFSFPASELLKGGELVLEMGDTPNKNWGIE